MTIMRLTKSSRGLQVILDNNAKPGVVYQIPASFVAQLLTGQKNVPFVLMTRLPFFVDPDRYEDSPLYDPDGLAPEAAKNGTTYESKLELDRKTAKKKDAQAAFKDKKIEW